jgi:hypothetical protein
MRDIAKSRIFLMTSSSNGELHFANALHKNPAHKSVKKEKTQITARNTNAIESFSNEKVDVSVTVSKYTFVPSTL